MMATHVWTEALPGLEELGPDERSAIVRKLEEEVATAVRRAAYAIRLTEDTARLLTDRAVLEAAMEAAGGDPWAAIVATMRRQAGMTRTDLARAMRRHRQTVTAVEAGRRATSRSWRGDSCIFAIHAAQALGVEPAALFPVARALRPEGLL